MKEKFMAKGTIFKEGVDWVGRDAADLYLVNAKTDDLCKIALVQHFKERFGLISLEVKFVKKSAKHINFAVYDRRRKGER